MAEIITIAVLVIIALIFILFFLTQILMLLTLARYIFNSSRLLSHLRTYNFRRWQELITVAGWPNPVKWLPYLDSLEDDENENVFTYKNRIHSSIKLFTYSFLAFVIFSVAAYSVYFFFTHHKFSMPG